MAATNMEKLSDGEVGEISRLAIRQIELEQHIAELEIALAALNEEHRRIEEIDLPNAMANANCDELKLRDGGKITVKDYVYASMPKDDRAREALSWLRENGYADVIKNEFKIRFDRGEESLASSVVDALAELGVDRRTEKSTSVHPSTLKALVRECLENGREIPLDLFAAGSIRKATVKMP